MSATLQCRNLLLKVVSRCNLNCTYCYMYNGGDETYKKQPKFMSDEVVDALLQRVKNYCIKNNLPVFTFVLHGGEPLLAPKEFYYSFVNKAHEVLAPTVPIFKMQTNGVLITDEWCKVLGELNIGIGTSLDGPEEVNDRNRVDHAGRGSYQSIIKGFKIAVQSPYLPTAPGIISFINIDVDPMEVYRHHLELGVGFVEFILPDATYDRLPAGIVPGSGTTPYADWLIPVFDHWFNQKENRPHIRFFELIMMLILGREVDGGFDGLGSDMHEVLIIETNGGIEPSDLLKVCGHGFTKIGANVFDNELDEVFSNELSVMSVNCHEQLCRQCMACPIKSVCGGGFLSHRYKSTNGFNNPSLYCRDIIKLVTHIQNVIVAQIPQDMREELGMEAITNDEVLNIIAANMLVMEEPSWTADLERFGTSKQMQTTA
jgi:uncharacterized protein